MSKTLVLKPRISEKAYFLSEKHGTYLFDVPVDANKHSVSRAVSEQYQVSVTKVNLANSEGKLKRTVRRNGRAVTGRRAASKKAYVTLKEGERLPFFEQQDQTDAKPEPKRRAAKESK